MKNLSLALRKVFLSPRQSKRIYSQFGEDAVLLHLVGGRKAPKGFYVDVGCHHPRKGSNTYLFYRMGWRGVLVDLEEAKVLACRLLRPGDEAVLAAVSDREEDVEIRAPEAFSVLASIKADAVPGAKVVGRIRTRTLTDILDKSRFAGTPIDLLNVDVEGVDLQVLRGLDFARYRPRIVVVESWDQDLEKVLAGEMHALLRERGYELAAWVGLSLVYKRIDAPA
jgi:FkbM family methyltransferase